MSDIIRQSEKLKKCVGGEVMKVKICTKCGMSKPLSEFHKNRHHKDGLAYRCKECANLNFRECARARSVWFYQYFYQRCL